MNSSFHRVISRSRSGHLFEVKRCFRDVDSTQGFIVAFSDSLILLHVLDTDTFRLNGYAVLRVKDIAEYRFFAKAQDWQFRAVRRFKLKPILPAGISVSSFPELIKSVAGRYPLLTVHTEEKAPEVCFIGSLVLMSAHAFTIDDLDCNGEWSGPRRIRFCNLTRIDFGGGYERALALTAPKRPRTRK